MLPLLVCFGMFPLRANIITMNKGKWQKNIEKILNLRKLIRFSFNNNSDLLALEVCGHGQLCPDQNGSFEQK